eukprot:TRINITY_DN111004_c0_g1_i1.p1 TRINITY_DN111004_c0_g1~~TRINITY_DN111004_c0_g1_i1.p1  ORF type:complete len:194 (+),score=48.49 TRINITY_DN111004_c0_g1_i1:108-689(+)
MAMMKAFVAFTGEDARRVEAEGMVKMEWFQPCRWVALRENYEAALESAMKGRTELAAKSAVEPTEWIILEISMGAEQVSTLFLADQLTRAPDFRGWRLHTDLPLSNVGVQWIQCQIPAQGMDVWAEKFLDKRKLTVGGRCEGCGVEGVPMWVASANYCKGKYCMNCWHSYFLNKTKKSLLDINEEAESSEVQQ